MRRKFGQWSLLVLVFVVFSLLPSSGIAQGIKQGGTVVLALADPLDTLVPSLVNRISNTQVIGFMFEGLVDFDMQGKIVPELAHSWEFSRDGLTWIFYLRKDVKWHDGKDFTSADVAFTIKEVVTKYHPFGAQAFGPVARIETPDPYTVVFKFKHPWPAALSYLAFCYSGILPKHLYEGTEILKNPYNFKPVGTGPFMFQEYKAGSHLVLVRDPNYRKKGTPYLDRVIFQIIRDGAARIAGFEKGEIDILPPYGMAVSEIGRLRQKGFNIATVTTVQGSTVWIPINMENKYLRDQRVRYALNHAINRQEIIDKAFFGIAKPLVGPIPPSIPWAYTDDVMKFEYDPAKANRMLDEAGYKRGSDGFRFALDFIYAPAYTHIERGTKIIQERFREVGVDVKLRPMEDTAGRIEVYGKKKFDLSLVPLGTGPDPAVMVARLYVTSKVDKDKGFRGATNAMGYSNPEVDRLFEEGGKATTREIAGEKFKRAQKLIVKDLPAFWIMETPAVMAFSSKLTGLPKGPIYGLHPMDSVGWKE